MKKSKIYTKTGDAGETGLVSGTRTMKSDPRIALYGEVDELNSRVGWVVAILSSLSSYQAENDILEKIQCALFDLGANLACEADKRAIWRLPQVKEELIKELEASIDHMDESLAPLKNFILPGGHQAAAAIHLCRTCCRAVEREMVEFTELTSEELPNNGLVFLNRLSDYFFTLARYVNHRQAISETVWKPA